MSSLEKHHNPPPSSIEFDGVDYTLTETFDGGASPVGRYAPPPGVASKHIAVKYFNPSLPTLPSVARDAHDVWREVREPLLRAGFPDYFECHPTHQVVEFAHGIDAGTLSDYRDDFPIPEIRNLLLGVIPQVDAMMKNGVVHGDIKPANLVVDLRRLRTTEWPTTLIDPDTMRRRDFTTESLFGTPFYMPPEVARGSYHKTTDAFSLAMTAIDLLSGKRYGEKLGNKALYGIRTNAPRAIILMRSFNCVFKPNARKIMSSTLIPKAADCRTELHQLLDFIFRCGDSDPDARPQSGSEMIQILTTKPNRIEI
ncbi:MAG: hypothetical protein NTX63_01355 [Candidatus Peregrinibacteria bacterium]|nr:hypothetical protein [Candidatus Peregrinibacteria bacterium]